MITTLDTTQSHQVLVFGMAKNYWMKFWHQISKCLKRIKVLKFSEKPVHYYHLYADRLVIGLPVG